LPREKNIGETTIGEANVQEPDVREANVREANAVDFWRGFALITIFINHIPGIYFERFTHRNVSISDSAELFVFLAGWGLALMVSRYEARKAHIEAIKALADRTLRIYAVHLMLVTIAIALLAAAATTYDNPLLLEWHNAATVFYDPIRAHIGLVTLSYQLGYFDILPLYVVLTAASPLVVLLHWYAPRALLPASVALYVFVLVFRVSIPTWPTQGTWFFNPLAWQLIFVLGFVLARDTGAGAFVRRHINALVKLALPIVIATSIMQFWNLHPDPTGMPEPKLLFVDFKSFQTPIRLLQFLALAAVIAVTSKRIMAVLPPVTRVLSLLGRKSLVVFSVGSVLSLACQVVRYVYKAELPLDFLILVVGLSVMIFSAWLAEWPKSASISKTHAGNRIA